MDCEQARSGPRAGPRSNRQHPDDPQGESGTKRRPRPIVAYQVTEEDGGHAEIVFHRHGIAARRIGANRLDTDFEAVECRRAAWADEFAAQGWVPAAAAVARGWHFDECSGCGARITEDEQHERGLSADRIYGAVGGAVYCCVECAADERYGREKREAFGAEVLTRLREMVRARFGDVEFETGPFREHVYVTDDLVTQQAVVSFNFPGQKVGSASLRWDCSHFETHCTTGRPHWKRRLGPAAPEYVCCNGDREAFEAWAKATRVPAPHRAEGA